MNFSKLSANSAREEILNLADMYSYETICREMVLRMSGDEAREFLEHFESHFAQN
jgi:hypothetical protein